MDNNNRKLLDLIREHLETLIEIYEANPEIKVREALKALEQQQQKQEQQQQKQREGDDIPSANEGSCRNAKRKKKGEEEIEEKDDSSSATKKQRRVWTVDLENQFLEAVEQLGIDKAAPTKILELMSSPGLTRDQIASHLQKYRIYLKKQSDPHRQNGLVPMGPDSSFGTLSSLSILDLQSPTASGQPHLQSLAALQGVGLCQSNHKAPIYVPLMDQWSQFSCTGNIRHENVYENVFQRIQASLKAKQLTNLHHSAQHSFAATKSELPVQTNVLTFGACQNLNTSNAEGIFSLGQESGQWNGFHGDSSFRSDAEGLHFDGVRQPALFPELFGQEDLMSELFSQENIEPVETEFAFDGYALDNLPL